MSFLINFSQIDMNKHFYFLKSGEGDTKNTVGILE